LAEIAFLSFQQVHPLIFSDPFREKYEFYEENVIAYIGRIHPSKGLDVLVKALPLIAREAGDFTVVIAGGGFEAYSRSLLKLAEKLRVEDKVRILGYICEEEKISLLDASKIFVPPHDTLAIIIPLWLTRLTRGAFR